MASIGDEMFALYRSSSDACRMALKRDAAISTGGKLEVDGNAEGMILGTDGRAI